MQRRKFNLLLAWFILFTCLQLSFGITAAVTQFDLNNRLNIREDVDTIPLLDTTENITNKLLIFFVDGMRYDRMLDAETPNMDGIRTNGTTFSNFRSVLPSYSRVNYAAFSTGSSTNITDVFSNAYDKELKIPTFYDIISTTDTTLGVATGSQSWVLFLGRNADVVTKVEYSYHSTTGDEVIKDALLSSLSENYTDVQLVTFGTVDGTGHEYGAASGEYIEAIENVDSYIGEILEYYQNQDYLRDTTIILFSDHGMADEGGHGANEEQQTHATLVLSGKGIKNTGNIDSNLVGINSVAPTILAMFGLPMAPTMNGKVLFDTIDITDKSRTLYEIQSAEIITQQLAVSLEKIKLISKKSRVVLIEGINKLEENLTIASLEYNSNHFETAFDIAKEVEKNARFLLNALYFQFQAAINLMRTLIIISIFTIYLLILFVLNQKKIIQITDGGTFTKERLYPMTISVFSTLIIIVGMYLIFDFGYSATHFNSKAQALIPNMTALGIVVLLGIFFPWLLVYLFNRKKQTEFTKFKDWSKDFLHSSIGTIAALSLPVVGFFFYYIEKWGLWPNWRLPAIGYYYAFIVICNLSVLFYLVSILFIIINWRKEKKLTIITEQ